MSSNFMSVKETAEFLGVTTRTLARWRALGIGPRYYKLPGLIRYSPADLKEWLLASRKEGKVGKKEAV